MRLLPYPVIAVAATILSLPGAGLALGAHPGAAVAERDAGWLPDPSWGPWYRFTDPSGANPDGLPPIAHAPRLTGIDDQGRYVVAGVRIDSTRGSACDMNAGAWRRVGDQSIVVSRYLADGSPDRSFGAAGTVAVPTLSHTVDLSDLVISGNAIYASAFLQTGTCGVLEVNPAPPASIVVRITGTGALDTSFGIGGVWSAGSSTDPVHLARLDEGAVGAFYDSSFAYLSPTQSVVTDLSGSLCSGRETTDSEPPAQDCPRGGRLAAFGNAVALSPAWDGTGKTSLRVFLGRLRDGRLIPDYRVSQTGIDVIDLSDRIGGARAWPGSNWVSFDAEGRLISVLTVSEDYPVLSSQQPPGSPPGTVENVMVDLPHGRGLVAARFVREADAGWTLDRTYADGGLSFVPLPVSGPESFAVSALGLDTEGRPVLAAMWWNPSAPYSSQFVLRLTSDGALDGGFGTGGMNWLPAEMPWIHGRVALDERDNQYFAVAWQAFSTRASRAGLYQLGRISPRGRVQVHDGTRWRDSREQSRPRLSVWILDPLPVSGAAGEQVTVRARVTVARGRAEGPTSAKGVRVSLFMKPIQGEARARRIVQGSTRANGTVVLRFRLKNSGYYYVSASDDRFVNGGSGMVRIDVRGSQARRG